jgi:hypothetical protein
MSEYEQKLTNISAQIGKGETLQHISVRDLLGWFDAQRRGFYIVGDIKRSLKKHDLVTHPNFEFAYIDADISFRRTPKEEEKVEEPPENVGGRIDDPTYRIGKLASANRVPTSVTPDATRNEAITLMLSNDYSQLPVMTSVRDVKGIVSWLSIGSRLALSQPCEYVRDCMDQHAEISSETSLFAAINDIISNLYVLIRGADNKITGIVTTSDLSVQFQQLGEPFLLLGEIENYIRRMIQDKFTLEELVEARDPEDAERKVHTVADLAFGEYVRLLENPVRWSNLNLSIDRSLFIKQLDQIRLIRNDVMHFDPDGIADSDLDTLRGFVRFLQGLANIGVI